jgi:hypothetical protein
MFLPSFSHIFFFVKYTEFLGNGGISGWRGEKENGLKIEGGVVISKSSFGISSFLPADLPACLPVVRCSCGHAVA